MRLFFAAWPPAETAQALNEWAHGLEGRATPAGKIHLTLAFLGEASPERALAAGQRVHGQAHQVPIEVAKFWKHHGIVWAGPRETPPALGALVEALQLQLFKAEFILERRPFAAHVTLSRKAHPPRHLPALPGVSWPVREFTLVKSTTGNAGSIYEILARFALDR